MTNHDQNAATLEATTTTASAAIWLLAQVVEKLAELSGSLESAGAPLEAVAEHRWLASYASEKTKLLSASLEDVGVTNWASSLHHA